MSSSSDGNSSSRRLAGGRSAATQIGKLRRPTRSAWLINLLARQEADELTALLELGAALQDAQQRMAGDELRQLSAQRRKTVDALARRAVELGREHGYSAPDGAIQEVGQTLQTALGDPEIAELVRSGRLNQAVTYGVSGQLILHPLSVRRPRRRHPAGRRSSRPPSRDARRIRSSAVKPRRRRPRRGSGLRPRARLRSRRSRRQRPPSTRMSRPTRSSRSAASCARPKPPSGRLARRPEPRGSTTRSCEQEAPPRPSEAATAAAPRPLRSSGCGKAA